jgi:hypothetical protein
MEMNQERLPERASRVRAASEEHIATAYTPLGYQSVVSQRCLKLPRSIAKTTRARIDPCEGWPVQ